MWNISFITEEQFIGHIKETIRQYGEKLNSYNVAKFNKNIIDPIKLIFDKMVYQTTWEEMVKNEIFRQRDKSNNNSIGFFHQKMFEFIQGCEVPRAGWDVIYTNADGITTPDGDIVHTIYAEMKNKHNTMNDASAKNTYIKMQNQLLRDDDCVCILAEVIAKHSQDISWVCTVDERQMRHKRIRRVSMDKFYAYITGDEDAFYKICIVLPEEIEKVIRNAEIEVPHDTVFDELTSIAESKRVSMAMAFYLLGFSEYSGFTNN